MSLHFLLDGYNIIKQTPELSHGTLENQRLALLKWISLYQPQGNLSNAATVVFDGKEDFFGSQLIAGIKIIFSSGESADDVIKRMVEETSKKNFVIVTNDKGIKLYVRALGVQVLSVREFIAKRRKSSRSSNNSQKVSDKNISMTQQNKITQEFEKIWIKSK